MEDQHEQAAVWRLRDLGADAAFFVIGVVFLLAGIHAIPTWWLLFFAAGSALWNSGRLLWHLHRSRTALKRN
jgi:hypothetical protein